MDLILGTLIGIFLTLITLHLWDYFDGEAPEAEEDEEEDEDWKDY